MTTELFIGGWNDGSRMECDELPIVRIPIPTDSVCEFPEIKTENYRRETIATQSQLFHFYVSESMSIGKALSRLLMYYQPPK